MPRMTPVTLLGRRILIVDDHEDTAAGMARALADHGAVTRIAVDGVEAVQWIHSFAPEIVVIDIVMPGVDGFELARQLRSEKAARPLFLVAMTSWPLDDAAARSAAAGFDVLLRKPLLVDTFVSALPVRLRSADAGDGQAAPADAPPKTELSEGSSAFAS